MTKASVSFTDEYNAARLARGELTVDHVTELTRYWQSGHGLTVDGMAGPATIQSILGASAPHSGELVITELDWLVGPDVISMPIDPSWFGAFLNKNIPEGIVAHFTDTDAGTAINMARRRQHKFGTDTDDRAASWHVTIETDGMLVQMIHFNRAAWHVGSSTALPIPGLGWGNATTVGVELVGRGDVFTEPQVASAKRLWRALVRTYGIKREFAMITHQSIDPTRRDDPGPVWMKQHAPRVLEYAYQP